MNAIEKSRSRTDIRVHQELQKSASRSKFLEEVKNKKRREASISLEEKQAAALAAEEAAKKAAEDAKAAEEKAKKEAEKDALKAAKEKELKKPNGTPKKMDEIFGPLREKSPEFVPTSSVFIDRDFDPNKKEIAGMSESVQLKKTQKKKVEKPPQESKAEQREKLFANLGKPAKFPKPKKPKDPTPPPKEPTPPPPKEPTPKEPTPPPPPKEATPPRKEATPPQKEPTPAPPPLEAVEAAEVTPSPTRMLPPRIGINGFNGVGRLILRAAIESGLEVMAVNDPFVPVKYMVYMLKFDLAMGTGGVDSQSKKSKTLSHRKEIHTIRESPTGDLIINGKGVAVFTEHDVTKIPWSIAGVNYVIEATDVLNSLSEASLHLTTEKRGMRMKHVLAAEELRHRISSISPDPQVTDQTGDELSLLYGGCKNVIIAGPSEDAPLACIGVKLMEQSPVNSHVSAPVAALCPVLNILHEAFKIRYCGYTLIRSIRGGEKRDIKCANLGPTTHMRSVKWDFAENLVPTPCPKIDVEAKRILPFLHQRLNGMAVYVPTPDVSMFDLTLQFESSSENMYRDACVKLKEATEDPQLKNVLAYRMLMCEENSASSLFVGQPHSCVIDAKSGCQLTNDTIKLVLWFDNEYGFANRIIDMIKLTHLSYCNS